MINPHNILGTALACLVCCTPALAATVTDINPALARVDATQTFTVIGSGLTNLSIDQCAPDGGATGNDTQITFSCRPLVPGRLALRIDGVASQRAIQAHHPVRTGNPAAKGLPQHGGVSLFNGNFHLSAVDLSTPTKGLPFVLGRSYNSYDFGAESRQRGAVDNCRPWRFNWEVRAGYVPDTNQSQIFVQQADGSGRSWWRNASGQWVALDPGNFDDLSLEPDALKLRQRDGTVYTFELPGGALKGQLRSVADVHGNTTTLKYTAGVLQAITDASAGLYRLRWDAWGRLLEVSHTYLRDKPARRVSYSWADPTPCSAGPNGEARYAARLLSVTDNLMGDTRLRSTRYEYAQVGPRTLLQRVVDPTDRTQAALTWRSDVFGNVGVATLANGAGDTWRYDYQYCLALNNGVPEQCATGNAQLLQARGFKTTLTPPLGPVRTVFFDVAGRPSGGLDGLGRRSAATSMAASQELETAAYRTAALPVSSQSALAVQDQYATRYEHDANGLRQRTTDAYGNAHQQHWWNSPTVRNLFCGAGGTSPLGLVSSVVRDDRCRVTAQAAPGQPASTLTYGDPRFAGKPTLHIGPRQEQTAMAYDALGLVNSVRGPSGETTSTVNDRLGRVERSTNPLGGVTATTYLGATSLPETVTDPLNRVTRNTYDNAGRLLTRTDARNQVTSYGYDAAGRLAETRTVVGSQVISQRTVYDALGRVAQSIDANNNASSTTFDGAGNVQQRANALAQATSYTYDDDNRVLRVTDPMGRSTDTTYDRLGRVRTVTTSAGTQSYGYDADGRVIEHVDARGRVTRYAHHPTQGHLEAVTDALGNTTRAEVDAAGNTTAITDPRGQTTRFVFDASNRRTQRTDPNGHVWRWAYDTAGNVIRATAPGGLITEHRYNVAGLLKQTLLPDGATIAYEYDANGNRTAMVDATGRTQYVYDGANRLVQVTDPQGKTLGYGYDPAGNRIALTYPHGKVVGYGFDAANRLVSVTDWLGKTHRYTLNAAGQVTALALGNGTRTSMAYDAAGRLLNLGNAGTGTSVISSHALTMDGNGNITEAAVQLPLLPSFSGGTKTMTYDAANRLATVDGAAVTHDDAGRLTGIGGQGYVYDARDLLTNITGPNAGSNTYNGAGHRVARTLASTGATTRYVIDPTGGDLFSVLAETDGAGTLQRSYIHGYGLLMQVSAAEVPRYYHYDPTGHTVALTDAAGAVTDRYAYTPYGETTASGPTVNPYRFVGKYGVADEGNGLHFMRARFFKQSMGNLLSLDRHEGKIDSGEDLNRYSYAMLNPVRYHDVTGQTANDAEAGRNSHLTVTFHISIHKSSLFQLIQGRGDVIGDLRVSLYYSRPDEGSQFNGPFSPFYLESFVDQQVWIAKWYNMKCEKVRVPVAAYIKDENGNGESHYMEQVIIDPSEADCRRARSGKSIFKRVNLWGNEVRMGGYPWQSEKTHDGYVAGVRG